MDLTGPLTEIAPAKINLTLDIHGRREDGYHELSSLVVFARDCADGVSFALGHDWSVEIDGPFATHIVGDNLVSRAVQAVAAEAPDIQRGRVVLSKNLPVAAGIGGGSADAAAVLRVLARANSARPGSTIDWMGIARSLGADVPVCMLSQPAWMTGTGDSVASLAALPDCACVIVNALGEVPADKTARVFRALGAPPLGIHSASTDEVAFQRKQPPAPFRDFDALVAFLKQSRNDLAAPATAIMPMIDDVQRAMQQAAGCALARVSGAGPSVVGLFRSLADAERAARDIRSRQPDWWVQTSVLTTPPR